MESAVVTDVKDKSKGGATIINASSVQAPQILMFLSESLFECVKTWETFTYVHCFLTVDFTLQSNRICTDRARDYFSSNQDGGASTLDILVFETQTPATEEILLDSNPFFSIH